MEGLRLKMVRKYVKKLCSRFPSSEDERWNTGRWKAGEPLSGPLKVIFPNFEYQSVEG